MLECYVHAGKLSIKWPNDIYWNDRKLAGTLTECGLNGQKLKWCIIGTGLNVNQARFHSDAPNPVSLFQISGNRLVLEPLLQDILSLFSKYLRMLEHGEYDELRAEYMAALYRHEGIHPYRDAKGEFRASIVTVKADGTLILRDDTQQLRQYQFKEVSFIL
jgi:BirA family biotin operon repressor/biotin-[acetyl-CoA-carboxylase] ligase